MLLKKWNLLKNYDSSVPVADQLLENRGIIGEVETEKFLNPPKSLNLIQILDDDFKDSLERSKKIILNAINEKLAIVVYGDYDADGVCATAILYKTISGKMMLYSSMLLGMTLLTYPILFLAGMILAHGTTLQMEA